MAWAATSHKGLGTKSMPATTTRAMLATHDWARQDRGVVQRDRQAHPSGREQQRAAEVQRRGDVLARPQGGEHVLPAGRHGGEG